MKIKDVNKKPKKEPLPLADDGIKDAKEHFDKAINAVRSYKDKMYRELDLVVLTERNLQTKSWGAGPLEYLRTEAGIQRKNADKLMEKWLEMQVYDKDKAYAGQKTNRTFATKSDMFRVFVNNKTF